jgi:hypothetical protein
MVKPGLDSWLGTSADSQWGSPVKGATEGAEQAVTMPSPYFT